MQRRGDNICYAQSALLASEQCKGSCWLWPQLVMKTLFSFLFQTMPPVWANCRKPKLYNLVSGSQDMPAPLVSLCLIQSIPWLKLTAFQKAEDPSTVCQSHHQMAYLASRLHHWEAIQWARWVSQEKFIASLCNWKMHFWFSAELKLKFQLNKL